LSQTKATILGFSLILVFFGALFIAPQFLERVRFKMDFAGWPDLRSDKFPVDQKMAVIRWTGKTGKLSLSDLPPNEQGYIVHFWATWCPPCIEELPSIELLHRQLEKVTAPHPTLVTVSVDEKAEEITKFLKTLKTETTFPILLDSEATSAQALGTTRFPESYWIRPNGTIRHKWVGPQNWSSLEVLSLLIPKPKP